MKKLAVTLLSLTVSAVLSTAAFAECNKGCCKKSATATTEAPATTGAAATPEAAAASKDPTAQAVVIDPVCGMDVTVKDAKYSYKYDGKTYYFCSKKCKNSFVKDPSKFIGKESK
jgi:YHS domain-containing protein